MLTRDIAPWVGLVALLGGAGLEAVELAQASRFAATALWSVAVLGLVATWWRERRSVAERRAIDRLFIAATVIVVVTTVLSI